VDKDFETWWNTGSWCSTAPLVRHEGKKELAWVAWHAGRAAGVQAPGGDAFADWWRPLIENDSFLLTAHPKDLAWAAWRAGRLLVDRPVSPSGEVAWLGLDVARRQDVTVAVVSYPGAVRDEELRSLEIRLREMLGLPVVALQKGATLTVEGRQEYERRRERARRRPASRLREAMAGGAYEEARARATGCLFHGLPILDMSHSDLLALVGSLLEAEKGSFPAFLKAHGLSWQPGDDPHVR